MQITYLIKDLYLYKEFFLYKDLYKEFSDNKKTTQIFKWTKDSNRYFTKHVQMAHEMILNILSREVQIKTMMG